MRRKIIPYDPRLKERARKLRNNATFSEALLWRHLKGKQILGFDFHRQKPVDEFIVDFFCSELCLAIEIDGNSHNEKFDADIARQCRLESLGVRILRFLDDDVKNNVQGVMMKIENWIKKHTPPRKAGHPSREGIRKFGRPSRERIGD